MYCARTSAPLKCASVRCVASSGDAPPAINSRQRSSRCCESSSTILLSRGGDSCRDDNRERTSRVQSGMFVSGHPPNGLHERSPRLLLLRKNASPFSRNFVETAAPLVRLFDPRALD